VKSAAAKGGGGLDAMLASLPASMTLNRDGEKKGEVSFKHAAHASEEYVKGITCKTCHHTQKAAEKPAKCMTCHRGGGNAPERPVCLEPSLRLNRSTSVVPVDIR